MSIFRKSVSHQSISFSFNHAYILLLGFYTFLFSHPSIIMKNPQWFADKNSSSDNLNDADLLSNVQSSSSLAVLKHQLVVLSKLYRNELQARPSASGKNRRSTGGGKRKSVEKKHDIEEEDNIDDEELLS